MWKAFFFIPRS